MGTLAGLQTLWLHLASDPLADVRAYYDAASRLNVGDPLYPLTQDVNDSTAYFYPPLFAMLFRPLALLPFPAAAAIWEAMVIASFVATLWLLGVRRREVWYAVGVLGLPIAMDSRDRPGSRAGHAPADRWDAARDRPRREHQAVPAPRRPMVRRSP